MTDIDDLLKLDATAQAQLVRDGQVRPIELVDAAIGQIERLNPELNAVITPMYDQAREAAAGDIPDGPFSGVPFLLKDLLAYWKGVRHTSGCAALKDFVPDHDSELVVRYRQSGLIVVGRTNTPELGCNVTTEPRLHGATRNPWITGHTTGGSSGGSSAAVAAGLVPMAHANDGGGSIRIPASCCGLFGLKPTRARNPLGPGIGDWASGLCSEHAVTRSVRDSATLLDATSGPDDGDPYHCPMPERPFAREVGADPGQLRIAFSTRTLSGVEAHADCIRAVEEAAALCSQLGHQVVEGSPEIDGDLFSDTFLTQFSCGVAAVVDSIVEGAQASGVNLTCDDFEPLTWRVREIGSAQNASTYLRAVTTAQNIARDMAQFHTESDLWLTPTLSRPPVPLGYFECSTESAQSALERVWDFIPFTPLCNATGQPGMSVPLHWNEEGLPIGTHFTARFGGEATLFRLAAQLEEARPWAARRPPVSI